MHRRRARRRRHRPGHGRAPRAPRPADENLTDDDASSASGASAAEDDGGGARALGDAERALAAATAERAARGGQRWALATGHALPPRPHVAVIGALDAKVSLLDLGAAARAAEDCGEERPPWSVSSAHAPGYGRPLATYYDDARRRAAAAPGPGSPHAA